jgi:hypothetical protein
MFDDLKVVRVLFPNLKTHFGSWNSDLAHRVSQAAACDPRCGGGARLQEIACRENAFTKKEIFEHHNLRLRLLGKIEVRQSAYLFWTGLLGKHVRSSVLLLTNLSRVDIR